MDKILCSGQTDRLKGTTSFIKRSAREGTVATGEKVKVTWRKAKKSYNGKVLSVGSISLAWQLQLLVHPREPHNHNLLPVQIDRRLRSLLTQS